MIKKGDCIIAGVSGGADSICLLNVLKELEEEYHLKIIVVHIEHGIRGRDSLEDAAYVREISREYDLEFREYSIDVKKIAEENHKSVEETGRELRYRAFYEVSHEMGNAKIAVAHNQNDQAETMLFHLLRGSGLHGLHGILPVRGRIIRPLLCAKRAEIEEYLNQRKIAYRTDQTNYEEEYTRNRLRLKVLPYIEENINKKAVSHLAQTADHIYEAEQFLEEMTQKAFLECLEEMKQEEKIVFSIEKLSEFAPYIQKEVFLKGFEQICGKRKDITSVHLREIQKLLLMETGKQKSLPYQIKAYRSYGMLCMEKQHAKQKKEEIYFETDISVLPKETVKEILIQGRTVTVATNLLNRENFTFFSKKKYTKSFDYDKITDSLQLRNRRPGDYLTIAQGKKQKLKSFFINEKIPQNERDKILLIAEGSHVLWVVGYRMSEDYKVTENTERILEISILPGIINELPDK